MPATPDPIVPRVGLRNAALGVLALAGLGALVWWAAVVRPANRRELEARAWIAKAGEALRVGQPDRALRAVAKIPESGPWAAGVLTVKGAALASAGRPDDARPLLERSLAIDRNQPMAAKVLAAVYFSDNDWDRGFAMLALAAELDKTDFRPWYATGDVLLRYRDQPAEAARVFREALRRRPDDLGSRTGLAEALVALGQVSEAEPLIDAILREHPDDPKVHRVAAKLARLMGRDDRVELHAGRALELEPDDVDALLLRAGSRLRGGRRREALEDAERAASVAPTNVSALETLVRAEGALGLKERAAATGERHRKASALAARIERLRADVRNRPDDPEPRWRLGQAALDGGMTALARKSFRAALALDPNCPAARQGLAALDGDAATP